MKKIYFLLTVLISQIAFLSNATQADSIKNGKDNLNLAPNGP